MKYLKYMMATAMASLTVAGLNAQTYNDTVRTHTWSIYGQGGASYYHGMRGASVKDSRRPVSPDAALGLDYNIKPWVRVGLNLEYTMLKATGKFISSRTEKTDGFVITDPTTNKTYNTTLETKIDMLQNRYNMHYTMADINADFNFMELWPNRKAQWLNLWIGTGVGYLHGWSRHTATTSYSELAEAKGDAYYNVYSHNYLKTNVEKRQVNALYIPVSLSLEFDITPRWTVGLAGQYKYLPLDRNLTPKGIASGGVLLRYNFVGKRMPTNKARLLRSLADQEEMKDAYEKQIADQEAMKDTYEKQIADSLRSNFVGKRLTNKTRLLQALDDLKALVEDCQDAKEEVTGHEVYFNVGKTEITEQEGLRLDDFIGQIKAMGEYKLTIIGEASSDGTSPKNQELSEERLNNVVTFLKKRGVTDYDIKFEKAVGDSNGCPDPKCRRVQIMVE